MEAFATYQDLEKRLNRVFTADERIWVTTLLEDASTYLRDDVLGGQRVYPRATSTFTAYPTGGVIALPQHPVASVGSVANAAGDQIEYVRRNDSIVVATNDPVTVTFTYGFTSSPEVLKRWACVLVSQALTMLELKLGLAVGGLSSVALDDFKVSFASGSESSGMELSQRNIDNLRSMFGTTYIAAGIS